MYQQGLPLRRIAILGGLVVVAILILIWIVHVLTTGVIEVSVNDKSAEITITRTDIKTSTSDRITTNTAHGSHASFRLGDGDYNVTASDGTESAAQLVHVNTLKTSHVSLSLVAPQNLESVSDRGVNGFIASATDMHFIDLTNNNLYAVDSTSNERLLDSSHAFSNIYWADSSYGVGEGADGNLYLINGDSISQVSLPFPGVDGDSLSYNLAPNRMLYVSDGLNVYYGPVNATNKLIYTITPDKVIDIEAASNDNVVVGVQNISSDGRAGKSLVSISNTGKKMGQMIDESYGSYWSPDGKHLLVNSDLQTVVTTSSLQKVTQMPANNVTAAAWLSNDIIIYSIEGKVWEYHLSTNNASQIGQTLNNNNINALYASTDGSYVYVVSSDNSSGLFTLDRVGLKGQKPSSTVISLSQILPNTVDGCYIGYMNFTRPVIIVHGTPTSADSCIATAKDYLSNYNGQTFSADTVSYSFSAGS